MDGFLNIGDVAASEAQAAFIGAVVLVFFVSPAIGYFILERGTKLSTLLLTMAAMLMTAIAVFMGVGALLGNPPLEPETHNAVITLISLIIGVIAAVGVGIGVRWTFTDSTSGVQSELKHLDLNHDEGMSFASKRKERLNKSKSRRR